MSFFETNSSCSKRPPDAHFYFLLLVDLAKDEGHDVEVDDCADEGENLDDRFEEKPDTLEIFVERVD
jgi:hypothetical protein